MERVGVRVMDSVRVRVRVLITRKSALSVVLALWRIQSIPMTAQATLIVIYMYSFFIIVFCKGFWVRVFGLGLLH